MCTGDYSTAADLIRQAHALYEELGNRSGVASALNHLGQVSGYLGDLTGAEDLIQQALTAYQALGNRTGEAEALANLGWVRHQALAWLSVSECVRRKCWVDKGIESRESATEVPDHRCQQGEYASASDRFAAVHDNETDVHGALEKPLTGFGGMGGLRPGRYRVGQGIRHSRGVGVAGLVEDGVGLRSHAGSARGQRVQPRGGSGRGDPARRYATGGFGEIALNPIEIPIHRTAI
ncbi:tetratricopeptide repeat protein [Nocardia sp. NEAU-G5]|uniref:Tetratricopeptide repeat protein n=1 Tax=Nocardia albiluteola TaxID=2842303 RepID=A0ABS6B4W5_9NOCA|nr:tetratricopeptide repeat protein [Nocardia albiluteola]MBU3064273.1 tetratricopeptide repeat protein [Nocardia albiluteola]